MKTKKIAIAAQKRAAKIKRVQAHNQAALDRLDLFISYVPSEKLPGRGIGFSSDKLVSFQYSNKVQILISEITLQQALDELLRMKKKELAADEFFSRHEVELQESGQHGIVGEIKFLKLVRSTLRKAF